MDPYIRAWLVLLAKIVARVMQLNKTITPMRSFLRSFGIYV